MSNSDKNITIRPENNQAAQPSIVYTGFDNNPITLTV